MPRSGVATLPVRALPRLTTSFAKPAKAEGDLNVVGESLEEMNETVRAIKEAKKKESQRFQDATDVEYSFTAIFPTRRHRDEFLRKVNLLTKCKDQMLDGMELAKAVGITLEEELPRKPKWLR